MDKETKIYEIKGLEIDEEDLEDEIDWEGQIDKFVPLTEEEQKLFAFMILRCMKEVCENANNSNEENRKISAMQMDIYSLILPFFIKSEWEEEVGLSSKKFLLKQIRKDYEEYIKTTIKGSC